MAGIDSLTRCGTAARHIFVVSRDHSDLYEYLLKQFDDDLNVRVILDRRRGDRRREAAARPHSASERRWRLDRRTRASADEELKFRSHAIISLPG